MRLTRSLLHPDLAETVGKVIEEGTKAQEEQQQQGGGVPDAADAEPMTPEEELLIRFEARPSLVRGLPALSISAQFARWVGLLCCLLCTCCRNCRMRFPT